MSPSCSYYRWILLTATALLLAACASSSDSAPETGSAEPASTVVAAVTISSPASSSTVDGTFGQVAGWITYTGSDDEILAVNPAHPNRLVRLSDAGGEPIAWSRDGTKLLIRRRSGRSAALYVLGADGSQTRLTYETFGGSQLQTGGAFSPDGSQVVYADGPWEQSAIYTVGSDGGASRLILRPTRRVSFPDRHIRAYAYQAALSPDGSRIAYFDGMYDHSHNLWVANADGTNRHVILDDKVSVVSAPGHMRALTWSPDGKWLAFATDDAIYLVRPDGSGLRRLASSDFLSAPAVQWSRDSSRIAYLRPGNTCTSATGMDKDFICDAGQLYIVNVDGSSVRVIKGMRTPANASIAWKP